MTKLDTARGLRDRYLAELRAKAPPAEPEPLLIVDALDRMQRVVLKHPDKHTEKELLFALLVRDARDFLAWSVVRQPTIPSEAILEALEAAKRQIARR